MDKNLIMQEALQAKGADFIIGMDIPRLWVTGVQSFVIGAMTMIVFREQNVLSPKPGEGETVIALKNVASIVMPTEIAREMHKLLGQALAEGESDANVEAR